MLLTSSRGTYEYLIRICEISTWYPLMGSCEYCEYNFSRVFQPFLGFHKFYLISFDPGERRVKEDVSTYSCVKCATVITCTSMLNISQAVNF